MCQPFVTTVGVLQGEANSPLLFNIFVNNISKIFDESCDPVFINETAQNCLLWADDLFCVSQSEIGLQNSINKVSDFYSSLGLKLNTKKTKILIFNKPGRVLQGFNFYLDGTRLEVCDSYQYLGLKLRPSGSVTAAAEELSSKARRAWFSISNIIYTDKRMPVARAFQLFDSLVTTVALYASEFWFPLSLPKKCFNSKEQLLGSWENLQCETINQSCSRMLLSVHRKTSRLAVMGELGRYPLSIKAMSQCINYKACLASKPADSLVGLAMAEMRSLAGQGKDCWLARVDKMERLLNLPVTRFSKTSGKKVTYFVKSCFDRCWLDQIKSSRIGADGQTHNKLSTYSSVKAFFGREPYIDLVRNRNQRSQLSRLRLSAHRLECEIGRYKRPQVPRDQRFCRYCPPQPGPGGQTVRPVDTECHCLTECQVGQVERLDLYNDISSRNFRFSSLCNADKFKVLVCSTNPTDCKAVNRFLGKQCQMREKIDRGEI